MSLEWTVVVPAKGAIAAKTRLGTMFDARTRGELAVAFAFDTVIALERTPAVKQIVVVTDDSRFDELSFAPRVAVIGEGRPSGLNNAARAGVRFARQKDPTGFVGVLLGDLPCLRPRDLAAALVAAERYETAFVEDFEGTGTTLLTARPGMTPTPGFGRSSAAKHRSLGHHALDIAANSTVRRDVDTPEGLATAVRLGVGPRTLAVLRSLDSSLLGE